MVRHWRPSGQSSLRIVPVPTALVSVAPLETLLNVIVNDSSGSTTKSFLIVTVTVLVTPVADDAGEPRSFLRYFDRKVGEG
jgi:hypothetical protein